MPQHLQLSLIAKPSFGRIDDLAEVDRAEIGGPAAAVGRSEPSLDGLCAGLCLKELKQGMAVENQACSYAKSLPRSFSDFLASEGFRGSDGTPDQGSGDF